MERFPILRVRNLRAGYGAMAVLAGVTFDLQEGHTLGILGPGGSGKSTLLRILSGGRGSPGDLWYEGQLVLPAKPALVVGQKPHPDERSLADRLNETEGLPLETVWRAAPAAALLLHSLMDRPLKDLPFGAVRLAELTLALAAQPPLLLLDEPEAGLDDDYRAWMTAALLEIKGRTTVLLATHHLAMARCLSDSSLLLVRGQLIEAGDTESFFTQPLHPRTQYFVRMGS